MMPRTKAALALTCLPSDSGSHRLRSCGPVAPAHVETALTVRAFVRAIFFMRVQSPLAPPVLFRPPDFLS